MTVAINPQIIKGRWAGGAALDLHTVSSTYLGEDENGKPRFDNVRSEIAQLLYRLKYQHDQSAAGPIIEAAVLFMSKYAKNIDVVVPVLPSTPRAVQPVYILAEGIAAGLGKPVGKCIVATRPASALKEVDDPEERARLLDGLYIVEGDAVRGKNVLLFDDLFRSGATMNAITDALLRDGGAAVVRALTITKTRSKA